MKTLMMMMLSGIILAVNQQQTIVEIKNGSYEITGKMNNSAYQQDIPQLQKLISIFNLYVPGYPDPDNLHGQDSSDYINKYSELLEIKNQMITTSFCLDFEPDYYSERSLFIEYNSDSKTFSVSNEVNNDAFFNDPQCIQFDRILIKCPVGITVNKRNINYACVDMVAQTISFEISDKSLVSKIEENRNHLRLLFIFNVTGTVPLPGKTPPPGSSEYYLKTSLQKIVAYNSVNKEIYTTYIQ